MTSDRQRWADDLELFLFDIGGTVLDEGGLVFRAYASVVDDAGLTADAEWFSTHRGMNKTAMLGDARRGPQGPGPRSQTCTRARGGVRGVHRPRARGRPAPAFPGFDGLALGLAEHEVQVKSGCLR